MPGPWAAAAVPLAVGTFQTLGGIAKGLFDETYDVDFGPTRDLYDMGPLDDPYGGEAAAAEGRVGDIANPYATGAMWDQEWARQQQEQDMADLWATARGERSMAREQGAETAQRMQDMTIGAGRSGSRFDTGARAQSMHQAAGTPFGMSADIETAAIDEQNQSQWMLQNMLAQKQQQDDAATAAWGNQQTIESGQTLGGAQAGMNIADLGARRKQRLLLEANKIQGIGATAEAND